MSVSHTAGIDRLEEVLAARRGAFAPTTAPRPRRRRRAALIAMSVVLALVITGGGAVWYIANSLLGGVTALPDEQIFPVAEARPEAVVVGEEQPMNILLLGTDSREGVGDPDDLTDGTATGQRSDTMMLVNISADRSRVAIVSIMRDSWVDIPDHGRAKINAAMSWGGIPLAVQTVESMLDVRIDHVAVVDFEGFGDISTALGGVTVESPIAFTSKNMPGYTFVEGTNVVEGDAALAFVRERYSFATGDFQRVKNQRAFMAGVGSSLFASVGTFDVAAFTRAIQAAADHLVLDDGFDLSTVISLGTSLAEVSREDVVGLTLPTLGTGTSVDGQSIVVVDGDAVEEMKEALADDDLVGWVKENGRAEG